MAIKLKQDTFDKLVKTTEEILLSSEVHSGLFVSMKSIDEFSRCDLILSKHGETSKHLSKFIDERPFQSFANEWLSRELFNAGGYKPDFPVTPLADLEGFSNVASVARRLVDSLCALPNTYSFTLQLPTTLDYLLPEETDTYVFSDELRLVRVTEEFKRKFAVPVAHGSAFDGEPVTNKLILHSGVTHTSKGKICLQYQGKGQIGLVNKLAVEKKAETAYKTFFGIAMALQFVQKAIYVNAASKPDTIFIHTLTDSAWQYSTAGAVETGFTDSLSLIVMNHYMRRDRSYKDWCSICLNKIKTCFSEHEGAERIRLAAQWLFDSYGGSNQLLSFVQATICMEILFGTGDKDFSQGLVTVMKNRCAYLIGSSHKDRRVIMDQFATIYKVRSTIVHSGQNELSRGEAEMLNTLRSMCDRAIAAEIRMISADNAGAIAALYALGSTADQ